jgi:hypothetical protein
VAHYPSYCPIGPKVICQVSDVEMLHVPLIFSEDGRYSYETFVAKDKIMR